MPVAPRRAATALAAFHAVDAVAVAIPVAAIDADLDRLGCPPRLKRALPVVKGAAAVGLGAGRRWPALGKLTATALIGYFLCAIGIHARNRDEPWRYVAPAGMLAWSAYSRNGFDHPTPPAG